MKRDQLAPILSFAFLLFLFSIYLKEYISFPLAVLWLLAYHVMRLVQQRLGTKLPLAVLQALILPWLFRFVLFAGLWFFFQETPGSWDLAYPLFDRYLFLVYPLCLVFWTLSLVSEKLPKFIPWKNLLHLAALVILLSLPNFKLTSESNEIFWIYLVSGLFVLWELEQLRRNLRGLGWGAPPLWGLGVIPLLFFGILVSFHFYRVNNAVEQAGLLQPTLFGYDFSPLVQLENEISLSDNLIFVFKKDGPPQHYLLRRQVLNAYDPQRGFYADQHWLSPTEAPLELLDEGLDLPQPPGRLRQEMVYDVLAVNLEPTKVLTINEPSAVTRLLGWDPRRFRGAYRATSMVHPPKLARVARNAEEAGVSEEYWKFYTQAPPDEKLRQLARELTQGMVDRTKQVEKIVSYFHQEFFYSLKPSIPPMVNPLHYFLFESRKGYCSYFAFSTVLLLRHLNIPSRLAVGFFTDPKSQLLGFYPVRGFQAHAWVEVLSANEGWIVFDPTTDRLAPGEELQFNLGVEDEFFNLVESLLTQELSPAQTPRVSLTSNQAPPMNILPMALVIILFLVGAAFKLRYPLSLLFKNSPRDRLILRYRWLRQKVYASRKTNVSHLTPTELASEIKLSPYDEITNLYLKAQYSDHPITANDEKYFITLEKQLPRLKLFPQIWRWFWF
jgi:transglutaminase-like putative cysteine protease